MNEAVIDLNGDVGEGRPQDAELIPYLTSVNIACGGHAGDERTMRAAVLSAVKAGASIGAHPSFPDREHFGRKEMLASAEELSCWMKEQIGRLRDIAVAAGVALDHVKPHGAMYNQAMRDPSFARILADALAKADPGLTIYALPQSELENAARLRGLRVAAEGFIDRAYLPDGTLAPRSEAGAVITDLERAVQQGLRLARGEAVEVLGGGSLVLKVDTLCVHGDTTDAVVMIPQLRDRLDREGVRVRSYAVSK